MSMIERPTTTSETELPRPKQRHFVYEVSVDNNGQTVALQRDELGQIIDTQLFDAHTYSDMKHGSPAAIRQAAREMFELLVAQPYLKAALETGHLVITTNSAPEVPTASSTIMTSLVQDFANPYLIERGLAPIEAVHSYRSGKVDSGDYATMTTEQRLARVNSRQNYFHDRDIPKLLGKHVVLLDDLSITGTFERNQHTLLESLGISPSQISTLGWVQIEPAAGQDPKLEAAINYAAIHSIFDLLRFFYDEHLVINERTLKYVLPIVQGDQVDPAKATQLTEFLRALAEPADPALTERGRLTLFKLYQAATSPMGFQTNEKYQPGVQLLETCLRDWGMYEAALIYCGHIEAYHQIHQSTAAFNITVDSEGRYIDMVTGEDLEAVAAAYSLMKFGSPEEVRLLANSMAERFIDRLKNSADPLRSELAQRQARGEYTVFMTAGSRNIDSASALVFSQAIERINVYLATQGLPTIIYIKIPRFEANTEAYATWTKEQREALPKANNHIIPGSELFGAFPVHIIFGDDVKVTGTAAEEVRRVTLARGALSATEMFLVMIDPRVSAHSPQIESQINTHVITGGIDETIVEIVNHPQFVPVQRMSRLLLNAKNTEQLQASVWAMTDTALLKIYASALSNDYLSETKYQRGLAIIRTELQHRHLVDDHGMLL